MTTDIVPLDEEYATEPDAGLGALVTSRGNLPLDSVEVRAAIAGTSAGVELTQGFLNPFDLPLEATYIFPLPDRAAVTAMRMECAGHVVEGVLKERSRAREDYDKAIAEGRRAAIAEEDRPDVFTMRVGNIAPGERVTVRLTLAQPLPYSDGEVTFRFPLVVAPRYIPGSLLGGAPAGSGVAGDTDAVPDASRISPPVLLPGFPNPVRLTVSADIDPAGLPLAGIRCSLHASAEQAAADGHTIVRLRPGERLDRDFILRLAMADHDQVATSLMLTPDSGEDPARGTFTLTLLPPAGESRPRPRDVVLVLDRSGSMLGWKIVAARRAAARIVDTLTGSDRFAVLRFDNQVDRLPDVRSGLAEATDRNRFRAVEWLARTDARGGTEMLAPLETAVQLLAGEPQWHAAGGHAAEQEGGRRAADGRDLVLVLITDGQVGNEDQILHRLGPLLAGIRVHVVGIDRAVNAGFLSRLAAAGRGRCELVESEDRLDQAAARIHRRIGSPLVSGIALAADGLEIEPGTVAPGLLPDLFEGVPVTVTGRWRGNPGEGNPGGAITVRGTAPDGTPFESKVTATVGGNPASTATWARAHLRDLEDRYACLADHDTAGLTRLEQQITEVSLRHGVLCRFTAFVAVDSRVVTDGGVPHRVTQPVELPAGWDPAALGLPPGVPFAAAAAAVPLVAMPGPAMPGPAMPGPAMPGPAMPGAAMPGHMRQGRARAGRASAGRESLVRRAAPMKAVTDSGAVTAAEAARAAGETGTAEEMGPARPTGTAGASWTPGIAGTAGARPRYRGTGAPATGGPSRLPEGRRQMGEEAAALRAAHGAPDAERARLLADLATRIDALLAWLGADPAAAGQLTGLAGLVRRLRACDGPSCPRGAELDSLWAEAIRLLAEFAAGARPAARRAFWKRPRDS